MRGRKPLPGEVERLAAKGPRSVDGRVVKGFDEEGPGNLRHAAGRNPERIRREGREQQDRALFRRHRRQQRAHHPARLDLDAGRGLDLEVGRQAQRPAACQGVDQRAAAPAEPEPQPPVEGSSTPPPLPTGDKGDRLVERTRKPVEETRPVLRPGAQSVVAAPAAEPARKRDAAPAAVAPAVAPVAQATQPRGVAVPSAASSTATPASTPATAAVAAPAPAAAVPAPVAVVKAPVASETQGGYAVQVGVFGTAAQAEALRSRLSAAGIPAQLETRVVVGPFNDRRDAVAAQNRLQDKGFSAGELIPFRR